MTHLPNAAALKMDGAEASYLCSAQWASDDWSRRAWRLCGRRRVIAVGTVASADLGGSSKYSNGNFED